MIQAVIEIDSGALDSVFTQILGRSAWQRHVYHLGRLGFRDVWIRDSGSVPTPAATERILQTCRKQLNELPDAQPITVTRFPDHCGGAAIVINGAAVYDPRLYAYVVQATTPVRLVDGDVPIGLARLAETNPDDWNRGMPIFARSCMEALEAVSLRDLPTYLPSMRRHLVPYWCGTATSAGRDAAQRMILGAAQKGVLDFPARFLHPWPENWMAAWATRTGVTPNHITVVSAIIGFIGTYLFATQKFAAALGCALVAGILDGVDGKLARIKLMSSPFGDRLDHTLDVSFEFSWYIALGWGLAAATGDSSHIATGVAIIGVMILNRALSGVYLMLTGRQIHDHTAFDRGVRLVAGRRNIFVLILITGALIGKLSSAFDVVLWWAVVTAGVYLARIILAATLHRSSAGDKTDLLLDPPTE